MKKLFVAICAVLSISFFTDVPVITDAQAVSSGKSCVVGVQSHDVLWIRSGPSAKRKKIGAIPYNSCNVWMFPNSCKGRWCKVNYRGVSGWAHTGYLRLK